MCSSSTEYEVDPPEGRSCEAEAQAVGSDELFELEAERSTRCSDLNPISKTVSIFIVFTFILFTLK